MSKASAGLSKHWRVLDVGLVNFQGKVGWSACGVLIYNEIPVGRRRMNLMEDKEH